MNRVLVVAAILGLPSLLTLPACGQQKPEKQPNPARLELMMEVAATTEDGVPTAVRFTLTNGGDVAVDLPMPAIDCDSMNGEIHIKSVITQEQPGGLGPGHGCVSGTDDTTPLLRQVRETWFHLRPGEFLTFMGDFRTMLDRVDGTATYEYWAEYEPPSLSLPARAELAQAGYIAPSEKVESAHLSYSQP